VEVKDAKELVFAAVQRLVTVSLLTESRLVLQRNIVTCLLLLVARQREINKLPLPNPLLLGEGTGKQNPAQRCVGFVMGKIVKY
jgi:hypothetical protein